MIVLCGEKNLFCFEDVRMFVLQQKIGFVGVHIFFRYRNLRKALKKKTESSSSELVLRFHLFIAVAPKKHQMNFTLPFSGILALANPDPLITIP